jgi:hypothetical protein
MLVGRLFEDVPGAYSLAIVTETKHFAGAYRLNCQEFYNMEVLRNITEDIHSLAPNVPVIIEGCDSPEKAFDFLGADGAIVKLYPGTEALSHFLSREGKGIFVNCREFVGEMQELEVALSEQDQMLFFGRVGGGGDDKQNGWTNRISLSAFIAHKVHSLKTKATCGLVVDADPNKLAVFRMIMGDDVPILVNHMGNNFDRWKQIVLAGQNSEHGGLILEQPPPTTKDADPDYRSELGTLHNLVSSING